MPESFANIFNKLLKKLPSKSAYEIASVIGRFFELILNGLSILEERITDIEKRMQNLETQITSLKQSSTMQTQPRQPVQIQPTQYPQPVQQPLPPSQAQIPSKPTVPTQPTTATTPPTASPQPAPPALTPPTPPTTSRPPPPPRPVTRQDIHRQALQELKELFAKVRKKEE